MISYLSLIRAIKSNPNGVTFNNVQNSVLNKVIKLSTVGCINLDFPSDRVIVATVATETKQVQSPEIAQETESSNVIERVQVSHWRDGARAGKQTSGTFKVVKRLELNGTPFVAYQFTDDLVHTVKEEYTKAVAA